MNRQNGTRLVMVSMLVTVIGSALAYAGSSWARAIGEPGIIEESAVGVCPTTDGGYVCLGSCIGGGTPMDLLVFKLDASGNTAWQKILSGSGYEYPYGISRTSDGGFLCAGWSSSPPGAQTDAWILKLDSAGNVVWQRMYGTGKSNDYITSVIQARDGGFFFAGYTENRWATDKDLWVGRLSSTGDMVWEKTWGGSSYEYGESAIQIRAGDYVVAGWTRSFGAGSIDGFVIRFAESGSIVWQKTYGAPGDNKLQCITETHTGDLVACGSTYPAGATPDAWVLKLDLAGNIIWQKAYSGPSSDYAFALSATADGGLGLIGTTQSYGVGLYDFWALKLSSDGAIIWQRTYGLPNDEQARGVWLDDGPVMAGESRWRTGSVTRDAFIVKAGADGRIDSSCGVSSSAVVSRSAAIPAAQAAASPSVFSDVWVAGFTVSDGSIANTLLCTSPDGSDLTGSFSSVRVSGNRLNATFRCGNAGTAGAGAFTVQFYLSKTARPGSRAMPIRTWTVPSLAARADVLTRLRTSKSNADQYLVAVIDKADTVHEYDESDNTIAYKLPR
ncbi:MAG: CARDB domain-containing protein [Acidobacteriota bacterium]